MKDNLEEKAQKEIKRIEDLLLKELENLACPAAEILPDGIRLSEFVHATNRLRPALIRFLDILEEETQKEIASLTEAHKKEMEELADAAEMLWVVLANVNAGDWSTQTEEWQEAAIKWRDNYFAKLPKKFNIEVK